MKVHVWRYELEEPDPLCEAVETFTRVKKARLTNGGVFLTQPDDGEAFFVIAGQIEFEVDPPAIFIYLMDDGWVGEAYPPKSAIVPMEKRDG